MRSTPRFLLATLLWAAGELAYETPASAQRFVLIGIGGDIEPCDEGGGTAGVYYMQTTGNGDAGNAPRAADGADPMGVWVRELAEYVFSPEGEREIAKLVLPARCKHSRRNC